MGGYLVFLYHITTARTVVNDWLNPFDLIIDVESPNTATWSETVFLLLNRILLLNRHWILLMVHLLSAFFWTLIKEVPSHWLFSASINLMEFQDDKRTQKIKSIPTVYNRCVELQFSYPRFNSGGVSIISMNVWLRWVNDHFSIEAFYQKDSPWKIYKNKISIKVNMESSYSWPCY